MPLLALLKAGDHVLVTDAVYGPTRRFCNNHLLRLGVDPLHVDVDAVVDAAVLERLDHRLVGVLELHVLADEGDPGHALAGVGSLHELIPLGEVGRIGLDL